jgi:hypothetical protein
MSRTMKSSASRVSALDRLECAFLFACGRKRSRGGLAVEAGQFERKAIHE